MTYQQCITIDMTNPIACLCHVLIVLPADAVSQLPLSLCVCLMTGVLTSSVECSNGFESGVGPVLLTVFVVTGLALYTI